MNTKKISMFYDKIVTNKNFYIVFGIDKCSYCTKTIDWLYANNKSFKYYNIIKYRSIFINILKKINEYDPELSININHETFPVIFYNGKWIGGYSDIIHYN